MIIKKIILGFKKEFFSFDGRMSRTQFLGGLAVLIFIIGFIFIIFHYLSKLFSLDNMPDIIKIVFSISGMILLIGSIVGLFNLRTKRCHDLGHSGWFQLIPIYNPFFLLLFRGTIGKNRFGVDPVQEHENWLKEIKSGKSK